MKKIPVQPYPAVVGRYKDQDDFAENAYQSVKKAIEAEEWGEIFLVETCGVGGGFYVAVTETTEKWAPDYVVFLLNPEKEYKNFAEVAKDENFSEEEYLDAERLDEGYTAKNVDVRGYFFKTKKEAKLWLRAG